MNYIEYKAFSFLRHHKLTNKTITLDNLTFAANQSGYIVKPYSSSQAMMILLGVFEESKCSASVTVKDDSKNTVIFINDVISKDKQLFALAHEIGHIVLEHNKKVPGQTQEEEANRFANFLLKDSYLSPVKLFSILLSAVTILAILIFIISDILHPSSVSTTVSNKNDITSYSEIYTIYYWTPSGTVYHTHKNCRALKNSDEILSGDLETAKKEKDRLCKFCEEK